LVAHVKIRKNLLGLQASSFKLQVKARSTAAKRKPGVKLAATSLQLAAYSLPLRALA
jgi:hypothetical protein